MKVVVKGGIRDLVAFIKLASVRKKHFRKADPKIVALPPIHRISSQLHPERMNLRVRSIIQETEFARTYRLAAEEGDSLPILRAGQYISVKLEVGSSVVTRPYSISSTPGEAADSEYLDITIQRKSDGFVTSHIFETWNAGTPVTATGPHGQFVYEPVRDGNRIVCIAGGCGITPFKPLIADILGRREDTSVVLIHGITDPGSIIFHDFFERMVVDYPDRLSVTAVNSGDADNWDGESGLIDAELISRLVSDVEASTFFLCGPLAMYRHLEKQLSGFSLRPGKIRFEAPGDAIDPSDLEGFPKDRIHEAVNILLHAEGSQFSLEARVGETILSAIERAGYVLPSECRSGECGFCRSRLDSGDVFVLPSHDGRRLADKKFGYIHPCSSYPLSDLVMDIPADPLRRTK